MSELLAIHGGTPVRERAWPVWPEFGDGERKALECVLEGRNWGGHPSPNREALAFADEFADYTGARHAVTSTSGTTALLLAIQAARLGAGASVITTAYSFVATAGAIAQAGCLPVPVDVSPDSYCIDPKRVEAAIDSNTEAIVAVHLANSMADMDRLCEIAERHGLALIEDCAHAHGARWRDRGAGSIGDFGCFSMQSSKLLTAGEGGAITTKSDEAQQRLWSLVNCGRKEPGYDAYPGRMLGHNLRITEWQAAILRHQLRRLDGQHERRAEQVAALDRELEGIPGLSIPVGDPRVTRRTHYQTILRYDARAFADVPRDDTLLAMQAEGLLCYGRFYEPIDRDPLFALDAGTNPAVARGLGFSGSGAGGSDPKKGSFPVAQRAAYDETIWLPHELFLGDASEVSDVAEILGKVQRNAKSLCDRPPGRRPAR